MNKCARQPHCVSARVLRKLIYRFVFSSFTVALLLPLLQAAAPFDNSALDARYSRRQNSQQQQQKNLIFKYFFSFNIRSLRYSSTPDGCSSTKEKHTYHVNIQKTAEFIERFIRAAKYTLVTKG